MKKEIHKFTIDEVCYNIMIITAFEEKTPDGEKEYA